MSISQDEIENWKNEGWTFRIKPVKGKQEKSLGRFDERLWKLIHRISVIPKQDVERIETQQTIESMRARQDNHTYTVDYLFLVYNPRTCVQINNLSSHFFQV